MDGYRLGFVGTGVMGEAILQGVLRGAVLPARQISVFDTDAGKMAQIHNKYAVNTCESMQRLIEQSDIILFAVKPVVFGPLLQDIAPSLKGKAIVSIVAGWGTAKIGAITGNEVRILCVMPNTPAICGEGMSVLSADNTLLAEEQTFARKLFASFGKVEVIAERYFDIVTGISGSGPAYVYVFIEALMQAGIFKGLPAKTARALAAQMVLGSAKLVLESDKHPAELRDAVCTPGGTTIEAVYELEQQGFTAAVMSAVIVCAEKYTDMVSK